MVFGTIVCTGLRWRYRYRVQDCFYNDCRDYGDVEQDPFFPLVGRNAMARTKCSVARGCLPLARLVLDPRYKVYQMLLTNLIEERPIIPEMLPLPVAQNDAF